MGKKSKGKKGTSAQSAQQGTPQETPSASGSTHGPESAADAPERDDERDSKQTAAAAENSVRSTQPETLEQTQAAPLGKSQRIENGSSAAGADQAAAAKPVSLTLEVQAGSHRLEEENSALRDENCALKAKLASAEAELELLRSSQGGQSTVAKGGGLTDLQSRLQQLREQQKEADEKRDKAWQALKSVIQEVQSLASTGKENMQSGQA